MSRVRGVPRRAGRAVPMLALAVLVAAGCGSDVDATKSALQRSTVPVDGPSASNQPSSDGPVDEAALTAEKQRLVDPCQVLDKDTLGQFGEPDDSTQSGFDSCANYMADKRGDDLNVTLRLGYGLTSTETEKASSDVEGLPANAKKSEDGDTCFVTVVTSSEPPMGIQLQVSYESGDACRVGTTVGSSVIQRLRSDPPRYPRPRGTLVGQDPCAVLDKRAVAGVIGDGADTMLGGLHRCTWSAQSTSLTVDLRRGVPAEKRSGEDVERVDLDGVPAFQESKTDSSYARCKLTWTHRKAPGNDPAAAEVVSIEYSRYSDETGGDPCAKLRGAVTTAIAALPKP
ncbi:MAG: DUF3558 domain-containing protein [Pseudonocardiaceae bacterium]|nr:DUF3558 domain-containing protein [Pseudonocardiaceae bacterium]